MSKNQLVTIKLEKIVLNNYRKKEGSFQNATDQDKIDIRKLYI